MSKSKYTTTLECGYFLSKTKNSFRGKYHLYTGDMPWLQVVLRLESSVIPVIFPWVLFCGIYGFFVSILYYFGFPVAFSEQSAVLTNAVLSFNIGFTLLLVFRTNTAHDRFWEGRQLWGALVNTVRNLTQGIYVVVKERSPQDRVEKEAILRLVVAFTVSMKLHLRAECLDEQVASLMSESQFYKLEGVEHPTLQIAFWIRDYLQHQQERRLNIYQLTTLHNLLDDMIDILGGCERILKTPLHLIYTIKLRQLLLIFCLILPLKIVSTLNWWTGLVIAFVSFTLLSIEQIGSQIEEPFGHDIFWNIRCTCSI